MENTKNKGAFTAPPTVTGNAELPVNTGVMDAKKASKKAIEETKKSRNIKVVALDKGWFDCTRVEPGTKFVVSEEEFSSIWMEKI